MTAEVSGTDTTNLCFLEFSYSPPLFLNHRDQINIILKALGCSFLESFAKLQKTKWEKHIKSVGDVVSEHLPDVKRLLETESNLGLTINKCHIFAEKDVRASGAFGISYPRPWSAALTPYESRKAR